MDMSTYAKSLVKQYDKNENMMLDADERGELKGKAAAADLNKDNVITVDELVSHLSASAPATTSSGGNAALSEASSVFDSSRRERDQRADDRRSEEPTDDAMAKRIFTALPAKATGAANATGQERNSSRFLPAKERLPSGLPSWFQSRDKNGDGQVAMSEYSRSWSARMVDEYRRYDRNDDGIITAKEVAKPQ